MARTSRRIQFVNWHGIVDSSPLTGVAQASDNDSD